MEKVLGIGGYLFRAEDPHGLARWYEASLGISVYPATDAWWMQYGGPTVLAPFEQDTDHFGRQDQQATYGRFAWATDPEGNRFELWQPSADLQSTA